MSSILKVPHWTRSGGRRHLRIGGILEARLGPYRLRFRRREELEELDGLRPVLAVGDHAGAGDVHVHAGPGLVGPEGTHRETGILRKGSPEVVGVRDADVALTRGDRLQDLRVAVDEGRLVRDPAADDLLRPGLAVPLDHGGEQGLIVDVGRVAETEPALPLRVAERRVGRELLGLDAGRVVHDGASPDGQRDPSVLRIAEVGRDVPVQLRRIDGRQVSRARRVPEVAGVDRDEEIRRCAVALGLEPLEELRVARVEDLQGDAGLLGERLEGGLLRIVARRVEEQFGGGRWRDGTGHAQRDGQRQPRPEDPNPSASVHMNPPGCVESLGCPGGSRMVTVGVRLRLGAVTWL